MVLLLQRGTLGQVLLVPLALGVREVRTLVVVQRQAEAALDLANVVAEVVRVLLQVDRLQSEPSQACRRSTGPTRCRGHSVLVSSPRARRGVARGGARHSVAPRRGQTPPKPPSS